MAIEWAIGDVYRMMAIEWRLMRLNYLQNKLKTPKKSCKHANSAQRDNETQTAGEPGEFASIYAFSGNFRRSICKTVRFVNGFETLWNGLKWFDFWTAPLERLIERNRWILFESHEAPETWTSESMKSTTIFTEAKGFKTFDWFPLSVIHSDSLRFTQIHELIE